MRKRIFILLVLFLMMFALTGCHGTLVPKEEDKKEPDNGENPSDKPVIDERYKEFIVPENFDTSKEYTITFWAKNDSNPVQKAIYNSTIERFESYYPNICVEIAQYSDYAKIYSDVITNIPKKTTPNVCITYPDYVATYLEGNDVVVSLDNLINDENYGLGGSKVAFESVKKEDVVTKFLDEGKIGDHYYTLPFVRSSEAVYINKDYVEKLGFTVPEILTWDFIWKVCSKAMEEDHDSRLIPLIYKSTDNMMIQYAKQSGIEYSNENTEVYLFNDKTKNELVKLSEYYDEHLFDTFKQVGYPANMFNRGLCIFAIDSTAGATWMGPSAPLIDIKKEEIVEFEAVVRPVPQVDEENIQMISQGPSVCIFNKDDEQEVLASWLFAQFLLNTETQMNYTKTEGYVPVTNLAINDASYQEYLNSGSLEEDTYYVKIDATKLVIKYINNTFVTPVYNGSSSLRSAAGALIEETVKCNGKINEAKVDEIFSRVISRYKITNLVEIDDNPIDDNNDDIINNPVDDKLPSEAIILIVCVVVCWCGIGFVFIKKKFIK